jgi:hypothetical protein
LLRILLISGKEEIERRAVSYLIGQIARRAKGELHHLPSLLRIGGDEFGKSGAHVRRRGHGNLLGGGEYREQNQRQSEFADYFH